MDEPQEDVEQRIIVEPEEDYGDAEAEALVSEALTELSPACILRSTGVAKIWFTERNAQGVTMKKQKAIPIRSVDASITQHDLQHYFGPRRRQLQIRSKAQGNGSAKWEIDQNNPRYQELLSDQVTLWRVRALDIPLRDAMGHIVWHPDQVELQDIPKAIAAFQALGWSVGQLDDFDTQVTNLSKQAEDDEKNAS